MDNDNKQTMKSMIKSDFGDGKLDKSLELNESMTIANSPEDEYIRTIKNIGGSNNG